MNVMDSISKFRNQDLKSISKIKITKKFSDKLSYDLSESNYKYNLHFNANFEELWRQIGLNRKILPKGIHIKEIWDIPFSGEYKSDIISLRYNDISFQDLYYYNG